LHIALAVAQSGSMLKAAEALAISQPDEAKAAWSRLMPTAPTRNVLGIGLASR
jgi:hypothetical protein